MPKRLLLADDSLTIQKVVGISFANEDVEITTVDNGDDALAKLREVRPDVVLADVVMPGKNGYEVCSAIKSDPEFARIPVLLLTGTFEAFDEERARRARADGHITKPFEAQTLVDEVNRLLARAAQPAPVAPPTPARPASAEPRAPMPAAAPAPAAATDDAFDFFEEDAPAAPVAPEAPPPATTAFELDAGESAFDFAPVVEEPAPPPGPSDAPTIVAGPAYVPHAEPDVALGRDADGGEDEWPSGDDLDAAFDDHGLDLDAEESRAGHPADITADRPTVLDFDSRLCSKDAFDFGDSIRGSSGSDSRDPLADFVEPTAAREAFLDPDTDDVFAVSASDLGASLGHGRPAASPPPARAPKPDAAVGAELDFGTEDAFEPERDLGPEPVFTPRPDLDEDDALLAPVAPPPRAAAPAPIAEPPRTAPPPAVAVTAPVAVDVREADTALTPAMRERVHDSLEKMAWEAFADLPDAIVRQALAKIEEIAWEVIPQMAEALIREEIRRMKGDG
jgi:CheY-like chemotaxis protein